jgi:2'-5' RNA ligase
MMPGQHKSMLRLFIAVPVPPDMAALLAPLQAGLPGAHWVPPAGFHVTLRFIGEVNEGQAADIDAALQTIQAPAGLVAVSGLGFFGAADSARGVWVGVDKEPALVHLRDKVESAVVRSGQPPEGRKFMPHITLAWLKRTPPDRLLEWCAVHEPFKAGDLPLDRFGLYSSHRTDEGPYYRLEAEYPLLGASAWDEDEEWA